MRLISLFVAGIMAITSNMYTMDAEVIDADCGIVGVVDSTGNEWEFYGDGYVVGEKLTLIMDNCGTADITDDRIREVLEK